jgi:hypothetical protein
MPHLSIASRVCTVVSIAFVVAASPVSACTTAVISGRATADGRPLLWKNRDISTPKNEVAYINDGKYAVTALVNAGSRKSVWMGVNSAGFCIENSLSKDLTGPEGIKGPGNGEFMLQALKTCATVGDFRKLLEETDQSGRTTNANYGVIDAQGGAAMFETGANSHVMFDANDPAVAPDGIIVRSNFSMTGQGFKAAPAEDVLATTYSGERFRRACSVLTPQIGQITTKTLLRNCARDLADEHCEALPGSVNGTGGALPEFVATKNTVSRTTTVSFAVFQGVRSGEDPALTTMWLGLGDPKFSVAVPCWVATGSVAGELAGKEGAPLCLSAIALRSQHFDKEKDGVRTGGLAEIWQALWPFEDQLMERVDRKLSEWRTAGPDVESMRAIHLSAAEQALALVKGFVRQPVEAITEEKGTATATADPAAP